MYELLLFVAGMFHSYQQPAVIGLRTNLSRGRRRILQQPQSLLDQTDRNIISPFEFQYPSLKLRPTTQDFFISDYM
jgi:hypothetical protein